MKKWLLIGLIVVLSAVGVGAWYANREVVFTQDELVWLELIERSENDIKATTFSPKHVEFKCYEVVKAPFGEGTRVTIFFRARQPEGGYTPWLPHTTLY